MVKLRGCYVAYQLLSPLAACLHSAREAGKDSDKHHLTHTPHHVGRLDLRCMLKSVQRIAICFVDEHCLPSSLSSLLSTAMTISKVVGEV